jgi:nucleoside-diphosphate-sugar epimerase
MKYFVTGATGFLGGVLAKKLREAEHEVHGTLTRRRNWKRSG